MNVSSILSTLANINQQTSSHQISSGQFAQQQMPNQILNKSQNDANGQPLFNQNASYNFKQFMATTNPHDLNQKINVMINGQDTQISPNQVSKITHNMEVIPQSIASLNNMIQNQNVSAFRPFKQSNQDLNPELALLQKLAAVGLQSRQGFQPFAQNPMARILSGLSPSHHEPSSLLQQLQNDSCKYVNQISNDVIGNEELDKSEEDDQLATGGRWTIEEKQRFINGLRYYGKDWKKVEKFIGTRSGAQVRSHAQKFFINVRKNQAISIDDYIKFVRENPTELTPQHPTWKGAGKKRRRRREAKQDIKDQDISTNNDQLNIDNEAKETPPSETDKEDQIISYPTEAKQELKTRRLSTASNDHENTETCSCKEEKTQSAPPTVVKEVITAAPEQHVQAQSLLASLLGKRDNFITSQDKTNKIEQTNSGSTHQTVCFNQYTKKIQKVSGADMTQQNVQQEPSHFVPKMHLPTPDQTLQLKLQELAKQTQKQENLQKLMSALKTQILVNEVKKQNQVQEFLNDISNKIGQNKGQNFTLS